MEPGRVEKAGADRGGVATIDFPMHRRGTGVLGREARIVRNRRVIKETSLATVFERIDNDRYRRRRDQSAGS